MRILLDECVPARLARDLSSHEVRTVPQVGWASKENGELLSLASGQFDVFLTTDQKLSYQQSVSKYDVAVLVLVAHRNTLEHLRPLIPAALQLLSQVQPGRVYRVGE
jgi:predicted nuclease of predicted toxin-antitoxin system